MTVGVRGIRLLDRRLAGNFSAVVERSLVEDRVLSRILKTTGRVTPHKEETMFELTSRSGKVMALFIALILLLTVPAIVSAQVEGGGDGQEGDEQSDEQAEAEAKAAADARKLLEEHRSKIKDLFSATEVEFDEQGRLSIQYDFESGDQALSADWGPDIKSFKKRVRWSRGWEGGGAYAYRDHTIVIAEHGIWLHKAVWRDVEMDVEFQMITEIMKPGDIVAAVYVWDKNRRIVGSNIGEQCVKLNSALKPAANPIPRKHPLLTSGEERIFGFKLKDGVLTATHKGRATADTSESKKFLKKLAPGHAGFAWRGTYMKGYLIKITFKGNLDDEWLSEKLKAD
jgi:hypothetical protein